MEFQLLNSKQDLTGLVGRVLLLALALVGFLAPCMLAQGASCRELSENGG